MTLQSSTSARIHAKHIQQTASAEPPKKALVESRKKLAQHPKKLAQQSKKKIKET